MMASTQVLHYFGEQCDAEILVELMNNMQDNCSFMDDIYVQCDSLMEQSQRMEHKTHRPFDLDAAIAGNCWLADSALLRFTFLVDEALSWVEHLWETVVASNGAENLSFFNLLMDVIATSVSLAKDLMVRFDDSLEDNVIEAVRAVLESISERQQRKTVLQMIKEDAYADPSVAALAELTKGGLKTRNKFYKRK